VKPGELERNLSRLVEVAKTARERLATLERELAELRHAMETLAAQPAEASGREPERVEERPGRTERGIARTEPVSRQEGDRTGQEAGSE
jgi:hypothetical protein